MFSSVLDDGGAGGGDRASVSSSASLVRPPSPGATAREMFKLHIIPFLKSETSDIRETAVLGLSHVNPMAFRYNGVMLLFIGHAPVVSSLSFFAWD